MNKKNQSRANGSDALSLLKEDHQKVKELFQEFEKARDGEGENDKEELVRKICMELTIHSTIEEEIFYPAVREAIEDMDVMDEAEVEHASVKDLVEQLEGMSSNDELYDAKVKVLSEYVNHHVEEEQNEMFPKIKKADIDLEELGTELQQRKRELQAEMGAQETEGEEEMETTTSRPPRGKRT